MIYDNGLNPALPGYKGSTTTPLSTYKYADSPTVYDANTNKPFTSREEFLAAGGDWNTIQVRPTLAVNVNPTTKTTSDTFTQAAKTKYDIDALIAENFKNQQSLLQRYMAPDPNILNAQEQYNRLLQQNDALTLDAANTNIRAQAGINAVSAKPIAMPFITGQQAQIQRQANDQLRTIGVQQQALGVNLNAASRNLQTLSANREQMLKAYELQLSFGKDNLDLTMKLRQLEKAEQQEAKEFAMQYGVEKPFYTVDGQTVYRTSDGKAYSTLEEWQADGGKPDLIQTVDQASLEGNELLSPTEAERLGVPYGTTKGQAASMGIRPSSNDSNGPGPTPKDKDAIVFSSEDKRRLASTGLTAKDISQIQSDLNQYGIDAVVEGLPESQQKVIRNVLQGVTPTQEQNQKRFLSPEWLWQNYDRDELTDLAWESGFKTGGFLGMGKSGDPDKYITWVMGEVEKMRSAGMTDEQIAQKLFF